MNLIKKIKRLSFDKDFNEYNRDDDFLWVSVFLLVVMMVSDFLLVEYSGIFSGFLVIGILLVLRVFCIKSRRGMSSTKYFIYTALINSLSLTSLIVIMCSISFFITKLFSKKISFNHGFIMLKSSKKLELVSMYGALISNVLIIVLIIALLDAGIKIFMYNTTKNAEFKHRESFFRFLLYLLNVIGIRNRMSGYYKPNLILSDIIIDISKVLTINNFNNDISQFIVILISISIFYYVIKYGFIANFNWLKKRFEHRKIDISFQVLNLDVKDIYYKGAVVIGNRDDLLDIGRIVKVDLISHQGNIRNVRVLNRRKTGENLHKDNGGFYILLDQFHDRPLSINLKFKYDLIVDNKPKTCISHLFLKLEGSFNHDSGINIIEKRIHTTYDLLFTRYQRVEPADKELQSIHQTINKAVFNNKYFEENGVIKEYREALMEAPVNNQRKFILNNGSFGSGKSTLDNLIPFEAGYQVVEINFSNRNKETNLLVTLYKRLKESGLKNRFRISFEYILNCFITLGFGYMAFRAVVELFIKDGDVYGIYFNAFLEGNSVYKFLKSLKLLENSVFADGQSLNVFYRFIKMVLNNVPLIFFVLFLCTIIAWYTLDYVLMFTTKISQRNDDYFIKEIEYMLKKYNIFLVFEDIDRLPTEESNEIFRLLSLLNQRINLNRLLGTVSLERNNIEDRVDDPNNGMIFEELVEKVIYKTVGYSDLDARRSKDFITERTALTSVNESMTVRNCEPCGNKIIYTKNMCTWYYLKLKEYDNVDSEKDRLDIPNDICNMTFRDLKDKLQSNYSNNI